MKWILINTFVQLKSLNIIFEAEPILKFFSETCIKFFLASVDVIEQMFQPLIVFFHGADKINSYKKE